MSENFLQNAPGLTIQARSKPIAFEELAGIDGGHFEFWFNSSCNDYKFTHSWITRNHYRPDCVASRSKQSDEPIWAWQVHCANKNYCTTVV